MYSSLPFALAIGAVELPYLLLQAVVYSVITYRCVQLMPLAIDSCKCTLHVHMVLQAFVHKATMHSFLNPSTCGSCIPSS